MCLASYTTLPPAQPSPLGRGEGVVCHYEMAWSAAPGFSVLAGVANICAGAAPTSLGGGGFHPIPDCLQERGGLYMGGFNGQSIFSLFLSKWIGGIQHYTQHSTTSCSVVSAETCHMRPKITTTVVSEPDPVPRLHPTPHAFRRAIRVHYHPPLTRHSLQLRQQGSFVATPLFLL